MPKDWRSTRAWRDLVAASVRTYGRTCHLCGQPIPHGLGPNHPLSLQGDHVLSYTTHPHLAMVLANVRPSHRRCNNYRKARPVTPELLAEITTRFTTHRDALEFFKI